MAFDTNGFKADRSHRTGGGGFWGPGEFILAHKVVGTSPSRWGFLPFPHGGGYSTGPTEYIVPGRVDRSVIFVDYAPCDS